LATAGSFLSHFSLLWKIGFKLIYHKRKEAGEGAKIAHVNLQELSLFSLLICMHISKLEKIVLPLQLISCLSSFTSITSSTFYIPSVACLWQLREDARTCCSLIAAVTCNVQRVMGNMQHAARSSAIRRSQLRSQGTRQESLGKMRENISRATDHTTFNN